MCSSSPARSSKRLKASIIRSWRLLWAPRKKRPTVSTMRRVQPASPAYCGTGGCTTLTGQDST